MPTKAYFIRPQKPHLRAELLNAAVEDAHQFLDRVEAFLRSQFERTFKHWGDSGRNRFPVPTVRVMREVKKTNKGVSVQLNALVTDGGRAPHRLWHWLAMGTDSYTFKKTVRFQLRKSNRTFVNELDVNPFPGMSDIWITMVKGSTRRGIKPRRWYELIAEELEKALPDIVDEFRVAFELEDVEIGRA